MLKNLANRFGISGLTGRLMPLTAVAALLCGANCQAGVIASDNAANSPYTVNSSFSGQMGGTGFGSWSVVNNTGSNFISSANWGSITPWFDIYNTSNPPGGDQTTAARSLNSVLAVGDTLSFDFVLNSLQTGGSAGFYFSDSIGNGLFTFYQQGNSTTNGFIVDAGGTSSGVGVNYNYQTVDSVSFTLTSATGYNFDVNNSLVKSGTISNATGGIAALNFFVNEGGASSDLQFTNLQVTAPAGAAVPVPASFGLLLAGTLAGGIGLMLRSRMGKRRGV